MFPLRLHHTTLHNSRLVVQQYSQIRNKSHAARRYNKRKDINSNSSRNNAKSVTTFSLATQRMQWYGMTPAWKRHLIHEKRSKTLHNNNSIKAKKSNTCTPTKSTTTTATIAVEGSSSLMDRIKSFSIGSFGGILGSLAGMGGGFVMIPLMTAARQASSKGVLNSFWKGGLGLKQHQAHGTSLFAVGTTGLAGALGYGIKSGDDESTSDDVIEVDDEKANDSTQQQNKSSGMVEVDTAIALAATAMVTARYGALASAHLSEKALQKALGAFMCFVAPLVPGKSYLEEMFADNTANSTKPTQQTSQLERLLPASVIGMFSGFLAGMFGVGGGTVVVPALVLSTDMPYHSALGTSLCAMVLPAVSGVYTHAKKGNVNWRVAPFLAMGSFLGAYFGGRDIAMHCPEEYLRWGFSCLMMVLGVRTWRKASR